MMTDKLAELVTFAGEDEGEKSAHVKEVVAELAAKPEVHDMLVKAKELHGEPLKIFINFVFPYAGYGTANGDHMVIVNPDFIPNIVYHTDKGELVEDSLERFFSHEFTHAAQPDALEQGLVYAQRKHEITQDIIAPVISAAEEAYKQGLAASADDLDALAQVFGEMYDTHIAPVAAQAQKDMMKACQEDEMIKQFCEEFEVPAIRFSNFIMEKYYNEPARLEDYTQSHFYDAENHVANRQEFIDAALFVRQQNIARGQGVRQPCS